MMLEDDPILAELKEQSRWLKILAQRELRENLSELSDVDKVIYEHSTEESSLRDIAEHVPVKKDAVKKRQESLFRRGLMTRVEKYGGRYVRQVSLEEVGLDVPKLEVEKDEKK